MVKLFWQTHEEGYDALWKSHTSPMRLIIGLNNGYNYQERDERSQNQY